jgi:acetolactate synthase-1/2/3 large subunit
MDAAMDSVPLVAITGQVPSAAIGTDAFQEADIRGITMPFTKHNYLVTDPAQIPGVIAEAFHIATTGRPGPVLVDVAKDALQKMTTYNWPTSINLAGYKPQTTPDSQAISDAAALIAQSSKPVFYVGGGVIKANAHKELRQLVELLG